MGREIDRLSPGCFAALQIHGHDQGRGQRQIRADFVRLQVDRPPHNPDRLVEAFEFSHDLPQLGERRRILGLERQRLAKGGLGLGEAAPAGQGRRRD